MPDATVLPEILLNYPGLFGRHPVNGRTVSVEELIDLLTREVRRPLGELLQAQRVFQERVGRGEARYDFLAPDTVIRDPDGRDATIAAIRQGMLDGFFHRSTADAWQVSEQVPIPEEVRRP